MPALPKATTKRIIDRAWLDLSYICQSHFSHELDALLAAELRDERAHRRLGARSTNGQARYCLSAEYAAKLFVLCHVFEAPESVDLADLGKFRSAVTSCYILAARMRKTLSAPVSAADNENTRLTLWEKFQARVREKRYAYDKPGIMNAGVILDLPKGALRRELMERTVGIESLMRSGPLFMALDYAMDIAVH